MVHNKNTSKILFRPKNYFQPIKIERMSLEKVVLRCFRTLSLSLTSLLSRPVFIQESGLESSMSSDSNGVVSKDLFLSARRAWPERSKVDDLPDPVRKLYDSWLAVSESERLKAVRAAVSGGFPRLTGRDSAGAQSRDLTCSGSPLPGSCAGVVPLTVTQIQSIGLPLAPATKAGGPRQRRIESAARDSSSWVSSALLPKRGRAPHVSPGDLGEEEPERRSQSAPPAKSGARSRSPSSSRSERSESSRGQSPPPAGPAGLCRAGA
jgi:hypothetical protein